MKIHRHFSSISCGVAALALCFGFNALGGAAAGTPPSYDFYEPAELTGTVAAKTDPKKVLFNFRRTATRSGKTVNVVREFVRPDGTVHATERMVYEAGQFVSFHLEEPASGARGSATVRPDPKNPRVHIIDFEYSSGKGASKKTDRETFRPQMLNSDMIGPFIVGHWDELMKGATIPFRFTAVSRAETIGFEIVKVRDTTWRGNPAIVVKMEPSSWIIAQLVDPLLFTVEKAEPHRVFEYIGRTTPRIQKGNKWEEFDAVTVFQWKEGVRFY